MAKVADVKILIQHPEAAFDTVPYLLITLPLNFQAEDTGHILD